MTSVKLVFREIYTRKAKFIYVRNDKPQRFLNFPQNYSPHKTSTHSTGLILREDQTQPFVLLIKRYDLYKVLRYSTTFFQLSLFCTTFFQLLMFTFFISSKTSSSQRVLGLLICLLDMDFHLLIFCTILSSAMRSTWPN